MTDANSGVAEERFYDEFGLPTSYRPWALGPSVDLILREQRRLPAIGSPSDVLAYGPASTEFPPGIPVIDLRGPLQQLR
jgi:hypothetical protein